MALKATIATNFIAEIPECYIVMSVHKSKIEWRGIKLILTAFSSKEKRDEGIYIPNGTVTFTIYETEPAYEPFKEENLKASGRTDIEQSYIHMNIVQPACYIDYSTIENC